MKAKVQLSDTHTGRCLNLITNLINTESGRYEFTFESLSDRQRKKIERYFGKLKAYYTKAEVIRVYNK